MSTSSVLRLCSILSGAYLKAQCFIFLRMLPLGYRFLPRIATSLALFLLAFFLQNPSTTRAHALSKWTMAPLLGMRTSSRLQTLVAVGMNILPILFAGDFLYRAHVFYPADNLAFSRTGFVDSTSARLALRHPFLVASALSEQESFNLTLTDQSTGKAKSVLIQGDAFDGVVTAHLVDLEPATAYVYKTTLNHSGAFQTAPSYETSFRFISTSCLKPFYPYNPLSHGLSIDGVRHLAKYEGTPDWIFFLGDWIYIDLPINMEPHYSKLFRQVYASPDWTQKLRDIPWLHAFDDHELINDYYPDMDPSKVMYDKALAPFDAYQGESNPGAATWYTFRRGDASFFVLDTRSFRSTPPAKNTPGGGVGPRTMLGSKQLHELRAWIRSEKGWKVVVSGVPFTRNWNGGNDEMDSWAGYLEEREEILQELWKVGGGVIVSGDRHEHATVKFPPPFGSTYPAQHAVIEFSTSPLSFFFQPFVREYDAVGHADTDVTLYQHAKGSSKFGVFDFDMKGSVYTIGFTLVVDGVETWSYEHRWNIKA